MMSLSVTFVMIMVETLEVGLNTVNKAAKTKGMSEFVFVVYSNTLAIFVLLLSSFFFYRKRSFPPITVSLLCKIFLLGLFSTSVQMFMYSGIGYSSPTLASAVTELTPAFTFLLALISRMEKLDLRVQSSRAKFVGAILSIAGALIVTLYKGQPITSTPRSNELPDKLVGTTISNWLIGGILLATGSFFLALLYIVQTWIIRSYPAELMLTLICCIFVTIQSAIVALIVEREPNAWKLKPDMELIAVGYSAVFTVTIRSIVHTWACRMKGPVYASMFKPLDIGIAVFMGVTFLGDTLYLGSMGGAAILAVGFYAVIWGQAQEEKTWIADSEICSPEPPSPKVPLLQNKDMEV